MPSLLIVTGPPGAGKSTVAKRLVSGSAPSVLVEGDTFFGFLAEGAIEPWKPESNAQNHVVTEAAASAAGRFAADFEVVYDGVVGPWFLPTFAAATGLSELDYVVLLPPVETCVHRVRTRTGHGFTDEAAARKMHSEFTHSAVDARHLVTGATDAVEQLTKLIESKRSTGELRYTAKT